MARPLILIVDDEPLNLRLLEAVLGEEAARAVGVSPRTLCRRNEGNTG